MGGRPSPTPAARSPQTERDLVRPPGGQKRALLVRPGPELAPRGRDAAGRDAAGQSRATPGQGGSGTRAGGAGGRARRPGVCGDAAAASPAGARGSRVRATDKQDPEAERRGDALLRARAPGRPQEAGPERRRRRRSRGDGWRDAGPVRGAGPAAQSGTSKRTLWQKDRPLRRDRGSPGQRLYLRSGRCLRELGSPPRNVCGAGARFRWEAGKTGPLPARRRRGTGKRRAASGAAVPARPCPAISGAGGGGRGARGFSKPPGRGAAASAPPRAPPASGQGPHVPERLGPWRPCASPAPLGPSPEAPDAACGPRELPRFLAGTDGPKDQASPRSDCWGHGALARAGTDRVGAPRTAELRDGDVSSALRGSPLLWTGSPRLTRPGQGHPGGPNQGEGSELTGPTGLTRPAPVTDLLSRIPAQPWRRCPG